MYKTGIRTLYVISTDLRQEITSVDYRKNINFMYLHLLATQSMKQDFKFKLAQNRKT